MKIFFFETLREPFNLQESDANNLVFEIVKHALLNNEALSKLRFLPIDDIDDYMGMRLQGLYCFDEHLKRTMQKYLEEVFRLNQSINKKTLFT